MSHTCRLLRTQTSISEISEALRHTMSHSLHVVDCSHTVTMERMSLLSLRDINKRPSDCILWWDTLKRDFNMHRNSLARRRRQCAPVNHKDIVAAMGQISIAKYRHREDVITTSIAVHQNYVLLRVVPWAHPEPIGLALIQLKRRRQNFTAFRFQLSDENAKTSRGTLPFRCMISISRRSVSRSSASAAYHFPSFCIASWQRNRKHVFTSWRRLNINIESSGTVA